MLRPCLKILALTASLVKVGKVNRLPHSVIDSLWGCVLGLQVYVYVVYVLAAGKLQKHKFENCMTIDRKSWGYRRNAGYADYLTAREIISQLVETVRFC